MNLNIWVEAVNLIDDDLISQAYAANISKPKINKYLAVAAVFAVTLIAVFAGIKYCDTQTPAADSGNTSPASSHEAFGGFMPDKISNSELEYEGTVFTKEEIKAFVEENKYNLIGAIAAEYGDFDSIYRISTSGYNHVSLGETNTLKFDYVDLPICKGNEIIAKITLFRNDGDINYTIAVRGKAFDKYNEIYQSNPTADLAFFYYGFEELVITPTNHIYRVHGKEETLEIDRSINFYEKYATEYNTFSYEELIDESNYINVKPLPEEQVTGGSDYSLPEYSEETTENTTEAVTEKRVNIYVDDLMSKEIVSVEWGDGYDVLMERPFSVCTDVQKETMIGYISDMKPVEATEIEFYVGGSCIAKLNYSDGSWARVVVMGDDQMYFETAEGMSPIYIDTSGNASALAEYMVSLI